MRAKRKGALGRVSGRDAIQSDLWVGPSPDRIGTVGHRRLGPQSAAPEFGRFGTLHVRFGKAKRGQPPATQRRSMMDWAVDAVRLRGERPAAFGCRTIRAVGHRARRAVNLRRSMRFAVYRDALNFRKPCLPIFRHSYVSHLPRMDRPEIYPVQVGHECDSSTAIYTHVSDDFMNTMLRKALSPAFDLSPRRTRTVDGRQTGLPTGICARSWPTGACSRPPI